jgi:hypothetical protein
MPDKRVVYECECGKRWSMTAEEAGIDRKMNCKCGRTIVVYRGFVYSAKNVADKAR